MAAFARLIVEKAEYDELSDARSRLRYGVEAAKSYVAGYTGLDIETTELEDIAYAVLVIATEMLDNRQMTAQYTGQNPTAMQIQNMHSTNLLPTVSDWTHPGLGRCEAMADYIDAGKLNQPVQVLELRRPRPAYGSGRPPGGPGPPSRYSRKPTCFPRWASGPGTPP